MKLHKLVNEECVEPVSVIVTHVSVITDVILLLPRSKHPKADIRVRGGSQRCVAEAQVCVRNLKFGDDR